MSPSIIYQILNGATLLLDLQKEKIRGSLDRGRYPRCSSFNQASSGIIASVYYNFPEDDHHHHHHMANVIVSCALLGFLSLEENKIVRHL